MLILLLLLVQFTLDNISNYFVSGVDHSKFRSCEDTSFCRRHRFGRSKSLYQYQILPDTIRFLTGGSSSTENHDLSKQELQNEKGLLTTFMKNILHSKDITESYNDPFWRGPSKIFSARLLNTSPITSSGQTETLLLNVHLHKDGVARIRITEVYGQEGTFFKNARWTSDELVLNLDEMLLDTDVQILSSHFERYNLPVSDEKKKENSGLIVRILKSLTTHVKISGNNYVEEENFVVFRYGDNSNEDFPFIILVLQLNPFSFYLWREDGLENPPLVSVNENNLVHFEIRRKQQHLEKINTIFDPLNSRKKGKADNFHDNDHGGQELSHDGDNFVLTNQLNEEDVIEDKLDSSDIIEYWEDGLATYADGTREKPRGILSSFEPEKSEQYHIVLERNLTSLVKEDFWEESFGEHKDLKPYGPTSIGVDITFPNSSHLYGLPEHASSTQLKTTSGSEAYYSDPYRLYNLDVFEFELDESMALYGVVPFIVSQSVQGGTVGIFWFNPTETFVDIEAKDRGMSTMTHWMSESGVFDLFLLPGPNPESLYSQYAHLTGRMSLPPMFSLGYHQSRWNYRDEADVYSVNEKFEELDYPYDVLWLDIEHTNGKRYFTWDKKLFPNPIDMQDKLISQGHRMVTIVDPHIKRDDNYYVHKEATRLDLYIKDKSGMNDFDGWCWPGSSSYLDFTNERVRSWWSDQFSYNKYHGSTPSLFTWNDMNEPSVFNGPEVSMPKNSRNLDGVEHREWHNLYGQLFQRATSDGLISRNEGKNERPFVLSRSFFAGSQRYGAIWTGDNKSSWSHLSISTPMLLSLNVAALSFVGADVGGFFGNPDAELMTRWMQTGAYQPFFRGHAHHDSKRREPWVFGDEWMMRMRKAALVRYSLLPYWYTVFYKAGLTGMPVMRSLWMQYPKIEYLFSIDNQYLIGSDMLIKPVTASGVTETEVVFPLKDFWYDIDTMIRTPTEKNGSEFEIQTLLVKSSIDKIPVYQRGGSVVFRKLRLRRSTEVMKRDPYTLYAALDSSGKAHGDLYIDDGHSYDNIEKNNYGLSTVTMDWNASVIKNTVSIGLGWDNDEMKNNHMVERIIIMGVEKRPRSLSIDSRDLDYIYDFSKKVLIVRKPNVSILVDWVIN